MPNLADSEKFEVEESFKVRFAVADDLNLLSILGITTCYEAYFQLDPSHDLADYCVNFYASEQIAAEFADPNSTYLIGEFNGKAVGFVKMREGKTVECLKGKNAIEVQRIYLLEKMKGKNFGRILIEKCCEIGREKAYEILWLGVWDQNIAAQKFYERIGMKNIGITDFSDGKSDFVNFVFAKYI